MATSNTVHCPKCGSENTVANYSCRTCGKKGSISGSQVPLLPDGTIPSSIPCPGCGKVPVNLSWSCNNCHLWNPASDV